MTNNVFTIKTKIEALREERISLEIAKAGHEIDKLIWSGKGAL